jgi:hypothetical protein
MNLVMPVNYFQAVHDVIQDGFNEVFNPVLNFELLPVMDSVNVSAVNVLIQISCTFLHVDKINCMIWSKKTVSEYCYDIGIRSIAKLFNCSYLVDHRFMRNRTIERPN